MATDTPDYTTLDGWERRRRMLRTSVGLLAIGLVFFLSLQAWDVTGSQYAFGAAALLGFTLVFGYLRFFWLAAGPDLKSLYHFMR